MIQDSCCTTSYLLASEASIASSSQLVSSWGSHCIASDGADIHWLSGEGINQVELSDDSIPTDAVGCRLPGGRTKAHAPIHALSLAPKGRDESVAMLAASLSGPLLRLIRIRGEPLSGGGAGGHPKPEAGQVDMMEPGGKKWLALAWKQDGQGILAAASQASSFATLQISVKPGIYHHALVAHPYRPAWQCSRRAYRRLDCGRLPWFRCQGHAHPRWSALHGRGVQQGGSRPVPLPCPYLWGKKKRKLSLLLHGVSTFSF